MNTLLNIFILINLCVGNDSFQNKNICLTQIRDFYFEIPMNGYASWGSKSYSYTDLVNSIKKDSTYSNHNNKNDSTKPIYQVVVIKDSNKLKNIDSVVFTSSIFKHYILGQRIKRNIKQNNYSLSTQEILEFTYSNSKKIYVGIRRDLDLICIQGKTYKLDNKLEKLLYPMK